MEERGASATTGAAIPTDPAAMAEARKRLVFALDYPTLAEARAGAKAVAGEVGVVKVGLELFVREGPRAVELGRELGLDVFLDLKLHDIPETVGRAVRSAAFLGARYLTVHAAGGRAMLERAAAEAGSGGLTLLAITVLTSLDAADLEAQGLEADPRAHAMRLAEIAASAGVRGLVASPGEAATLKAALPDALVATPGIRPEGGAAGDQKRVATAAGAIAAGADLLVVGRPIRDAADPRAAAAALALEIARALSARAELHDGRGAGA